MAVEGSLPRDLESVADWFVGILVSAVVLLTMWALFSPQKPVQAGKQIEWEGLSIVRQTPRGTVVKFQDGPNECYIVIPDSGPYPSISCVKRSASAVLENLESTSPAAQNRGQVSK